MNEFVARLKQRKLVQWALAYLAAAWVSLQVLSLATDSWADAPDLAVKTIRQLLAMPAGGVMSIERLKLDPVWDPLRKDSAFQALLAKYADRLPATALSDARHD